MTFKDRYEAEPSWHGKATIMEIFHLTMTQRESQWTVTKTAQYFDCSIGLTSENLRLAIKLHTDPKLMKCETRQQALTKLNGVKRESHW